MRQMKKILAFTLVLTLLLALAVPAMADSSHTLTINGKEGYSFTAYQIFAGDYAELGTAPVQRILSNVVWGVHANDTIKTALQAQFAPDNDNATAADIAEEIQTEGDAKTFAGIVKDNLGATASAYTAIIAAGQTSCEITDLPSGYYYVKTEATGDAEQPDKIGAIVEVIDDASVTAKVEDKPKSEKVVDDINDSTGAAENAQNTADHDIGDQVPFTLTATLPENLLNDTTSYAITLHDEMTAGLTFDKTAVKVYIQHKNNTPSEVTSGFTVSDGEEISDEGAYKGGTRFSVTIANVMAAPFSANAGDTIIVKYTATLNEHAVIGEAGNLNRYRLEYGSGSFTEWDVTTVFTFDLVVNKVKNGTSESQTEALVGAAFKLEKWMAATETDVAQWKVIAELGTETQISTFTFKGLDDGQYRLTETVTPAGYNSIDPIYFVVTASHNDGQTNRLSLEAYQTDANWTKLEDANKTYTLTVSNTTGVISTSVLNQQGIVLPSTGGMGTTLFYVVGAVLMLGALVLLVAKKRQH